MNENNVYAYKSLLINISFCILFVFNDFMDSLFWVSSGIVVGANYFDSGKRSCNCETNEICESSLEG